MDRQRAPSSGRGAAVAALFAWSALGAGCTQAMEPPGSTGYVLLDRAARDAFTLSQDGWAGAPVLPVALDAREPAALVGPGGAEQPLALRADQLAHVRGADAAITWLEIGTDLRDDRLVLHATDAAAAELAAWIGGEATARGDGLWNLIAEDVLDRSAFLDPPEGVLEAMPDTQFYIWGSGSPDGALRPKPRVYLDVGDVDAPSSAAIAKIAILGAAGGIGDDAALGGADGREEAELVGVYVAGAKALLLDAGGGFLLEDRCTGEALLAGRFHAVEDRVVLSAGDAAPMVFARKRDILIHPGGARFAPLVPGKPVADFGGVR